MIGALVLGSMLESSLRRSLMMSDGNLMIFPKRPISAVFLVVALIFVISPMFTTERIGKKAIEAKDG
jgi:putative tricarboxylic transport membrane protein